MTPERSGSGWPVRLSDPARPRVAVRVARIRVSEALRQRRGRGSGLRPRQRRLRRAPRARGADLRRRRAGPDAARSACSSGPTCSASIARTALRCVVLFPTRWRAWPSTSRGGARCSRATRSKPTSTSVVAAPCERSRGSRRPVGRFRAALVNELCAAYMFADSLIDLEHDLAFGLINVPAEDVAEGVDPLQADERLACWAAEEALRCEARLASARRRLRELRVAPPARARPHAGDEAPQAPPLPRRGWLAPCGSDAERGSSVRTRARPAAIALIAPGAASARAGRRRCLAQAPAAGLSA